MNGVTLQKKNDSNKWQALGFASSAQVSMVLWHKAFWYSSSVDKPETEHIMVYTPFINTTPQVMACFSSNNEYRSNQKKTLVLKSK